MLFVIYSLLSFTFYLDQKRLDFVCILSDLEVMTSTRTFLFFIGLAVLFAVAFSGVAAQDRSFRIANDAFMVPLR